MAKIAHTVKITQQYAPSATTTVLLNHAPSQRELQQLKDALEAKKKWQCQGVTTFGKIVTAAVTEVFGDDWYYLGESRVVF